MRSEDEHNLLRQLGEGDENAFASLYVRHFPKVKRFIESLLQDPDEAMDLAQDIFIRIWQKRTDMPKIDNLNAYLYTASRHAVADHVRHLIMAKAHDDSLLLRAQTADFSRQSSIEEDLHVRELGLLIRNAVNRMPTQRKRVYEMSREQGKSNDEIAMRLSISKRTVENHLTQALAYLRKTLREVRIFLF